MRFSYLLCLFFIIPLGVHAQYPGPAGSSGSTAIAGDSSIFVGWASSIETELASIDITDPNATLANTGSSAAALGPADNQVISLGDGGAATLFFDPPIMNGLGADFAVFENSFLEGFLELAFVEVSSDGEHFFRFPAVSLHQDTLQFGPFDNLMQAQKLHNLAGKYVANFGTPFDLAELEDDPLLDKSNIQYVKLIDVIGSIDPDIGQSDFAGTIINDPFPTPFPSCGFDLDAVGVIHQAVGYSKMNRGQHVELYPNPASEVIYLRSDQVIQIEEPGRLEIRSLAGKVCLIDSTYLVGHSIQIGALNKGTYILYFKNRDIVLVKPFIKQ